MPTPYPGSAGSRSPCSAATAPRKPNGTWVRTPAPSPVFRSDPLAPRCSRLTSTVSASRTIPWEGRPAMSQTNPNPQELCSNDGS